MKNTFEINYREDNWHSLATLEIKGDRLLVSTSIWIEGKKPLSLKANFSLSFIQERLSTGLNPFKQYTILLFPLSEDFEWKTMILPEQQEDFFKFLDIKTHRK